MAKICLLQHKFVMIFYGKAKLWSDSVLSYVLGIHQKPSDLFQARISTWPTNIDRLSPRVNEPFISHE